MINSPITRFCFGAAAAALYKPLQSAVQLVGKQTGLFASCDPKPAAFEELLSKIPDSSGYFGISVNTTQIFNSADPRQELERQILADRPDLEILLGALKTKQFVEQVFYAPIVEEIQIRYVVQDLLLKRLPKILLQNVGGAAHFESAKAKAIRIAFSSALFGALHLQNRLPCVYSQSAGAFIAGIFLGLLKESRAGLSGSIGAHMANNLYSIL